MLIAVLLVGVFLPDFVRNTTFVGAEIDLVVMESGVK